MSNLTMLEVLKLLDNGHELREYKETRNTFAGWVIDNRPVHGNTVVALARRDQINIITLTARQRYGGHVVRIARRVSP